jgi:hypothetical protein
VSNLVGAAARAAVETLVRLTHDTNWLYVGVACASEPGQPLAAGYKGRDNSGTTQDDSIELFLDRAPQRDKHDYFHFMLSAGGAKREQRVTGATQYPSWSVSWPSAVTATDGCWRAELAIPLYMLGDDRIGPLGFNVTRNKRTDPQQSITWAPLAGAGRGAYYSPESFGTLKGLTGLPVQPRCAPLIERAYDTTLFRESQDRYSYTFRVLLSNPGGVAGAATVSVEDRETLSGRAVRHAFAIRVPSEGQTNYTFEVPVTNPVERSVRVALADEAARDEAWIEAEGAAVLQSLTAYPDLNYYSGERQGRLTIGTVFPDHGFRKRKLRIALTVARADGRVVHERTYTRTRHQGVVFEFDPGSWAPGVYTVAAALQDAAGGSLAARRTEIRVEPPPPAGIRVTKIDQERMCLLLNGRPFFPIGFCNSAGFGAITVLNDRTWATEQADFLRRCADGGFNTLIHWHGARLGNRRASSGAPWADDMDRTLAAELAANVRDYARADAAGICVIPQSLSHITIHNNNARVVRQDFDLVMAKLPGVVSAYARLPNVIGVQGRDEVSPEVLDEAAAHAARMRAADPYHFIFATCRGILPENYDAYDILGVHAYWGPDTDPNRLASWIQGGFHSAKTRRRPVFATPQGQRLEYRRELTPQERRCGIYAPLIQGAKGVFFFAINGYDTYHPVTWRVLAYTARELNILAPTLLQNPPPQTVAFALAAAAAPPAVPPLPRPRTRFDPAPGSRAGARGPGQENMPVVQALVHDAADGTGSEVILVANTGPAPLKCGLALSSLGPGSRVFGFFDPQAYPVREGMFEDILEPFAVRVYRTDGSSRAKGAPVALGIRAVPGRRNPAAPPSFYTPEDRRVQTGGYEKKENEYIWSAVEDQEQIRLDAKGGCKNVLENSSFEEYALPMLPDNWIHSYSMRHLGRNLFGQQTNEVYEGGYSLRLQPDEPGRAAYYPTVSYRYWTDWKFDTDYVLSAYVKASRADVVVRMAVLPDRPDRNYAETDGIVRDFTIGPAWQRIAWPLRFIRAELPAWPPEGKMLKPGLRVVPGPTNRPPADVWVDAVQLESGAVATPYERDAYQAPPLDPRWLSDDVFRDLAERSPDAR